MQKQRILIAGSSIAGPALAYWLAQQGAEVTVVERASRLREGGQAVDFRGPAHLEVLARMGILSEIRAVQTHMRELVMIDVRGRRLLALPAAFASGELEILRGDLSRILHDATAARVEYVFGNQITELAQDTTGVHVRFAHTAPRRFELVVGADGLHSGVRAHVFGPEHQFIRFHDYYVAIFGSDNWLGLDHSGVLCSELGRSASISSAREPGRASNLFVFASPALDHDRHDSAQQKRILADTYAGMGWEVPRMLEALERADDLYFDAISHVELDHYARGRVVLLGDAAWGGTLGGQGTGLAIVGAYVLAGELARSPGDPRSAFARYEGLMRGYAGSCQQGSKRVGPFFAPRTRAGYWLRNAVYGALTSHSLAPLLDRLVTTSASAIALPQY